MSLETLRLTLLPSAPEHLLALTDQPERFELLTGLHAAEGLRGLLVSDEASPALEAAERGQVRNNGISLALDSSSLTS